jgi:hypothetical protein
MYPRRTKILRRPIGWKDLGKMKTVNYASDGEIYTNKSVCPLCKSRVRIGKQEGNIFGYCKKCEVLINLK